MNVKLQKMPKAPKANASAKSQAVYLKKVAAVTKANQQRLEIANRISGLQGQLNGIGKKKKSATKKKRRK